MRLALPVAFSTADAWHDVDDLIEQQANLGKISIPSCISLAQGFAEMVRRDFPAQSDDSEFYETIHDSG